MGLPNLEVEQLQMKQTQMGRWAAPIGPLATGKEVHNQNVSEVLGEHLQRQSGLGTCSDCGFGLEHESLDHSTKLVRVHLLVCLTG